MAIKKTSLVEIAAERMKQNIIENNLRPGDKFLSEKELIQQLEVSRTVVREALRSLSSIGIVEVRKGGGVYVGHSSFDSIRNILEHHHAVHGVKLRELADIRKVIELGAVRLIIENDLQIDRSCFEEINRSYHEAILAGKDTKKYDQQFHQQLMKETGNDTFYKFAEVIQEYFSLVKIDLVQSRDSLIKSYEEHEDIIAALVQKDLVRGHRLIAEHLEPVFTFIRQVEEARGDGTDQ
ncbi:FadR/GntR family transcriptional regulator [Salinicoccus carnicancri]|uniref:FadR/GntR family transcriptional regulator n=1 Tax=Salinicoccus carnicancri TaxID=558170 RepID=UPI000312C332|nr:GntR family transcriptional regulator [Salinicoccus carnicancri]